MTEETIAESYRDTKFSRLIEKQAHDQGLEEGLEQGLEQGTARTLTALLRTRFGNHSRSRPSPGIWPTRWTPTPASAS